MSPTAGVIVRQLIADICAHHSPISLGDQIIYMTQNENTLRLKDCEQKYLIKCVADVEE